MRTRPSSTSSHNPRPAKRDPYWEVVEQQWPFIMMLYQQYANKKPVMLFDMQEQRVYALPYRAYRAELSERSQASLTRQYERAIARREVVIFVRDHDKKKLVSFSVPLEN